MIVSENIKLELSVPFDNSDVESMLRKRGIEPLRWAVTDVGEGFVTVTFSYVRPPK